MPELALLNYHPIPSLKCDLGYPHYAMEEDLQSAVAEFFGKKDVELFAK